MFLRRSRRCGFRPYPVPAGRQNRPCDIDTLFVLKAFADGADGVLVSGCHFGDCHYLAGNYKAAKRMFLVKSIMQNMGLEHRRFRMTFVSASEGAKWAVVINDVINTVKEIGPSPIAAERKRRGL